MQGEHVNWTDFCGCDFFVYRNGTLGSCFTKTVIALPCFTVMSIICAYYAGYSKRNFIQNPFSQSLINIRMVFAIFILTTSLIGPIVLLSYNETKLTLVDDTFLVFKVVAWLLHLFYLWKLRKGVTLNSRGHSLVTFSVFIVMISESLLTWTSLKLAFFVNNEVYDLITSSLTLSFILCYFITLIPTGALPNRYGYANVNNEEEQSFVSSSRVYGTFYEELNAYDLGVAEEDHNWLSKLTYWWVRKLMRKGYKGLIKTESDLYDLPSPLKSENIGSEINHYYQSVSASTLAGSLEELRFLDSGSTTEEEVSVRQRKRFLIHVLNKCFGVEFYSLGILKFFSDAISFVGPILLNYLVTFIEDGTQPVQYGYYYAIGLSASTLLAAFLSTHFSYLVSRVSLKVRAAVIHMIYQKTLSVNTCTLSAFNTGEIVNFMSSDTDRIVNFCQSFHQFWSLPVQIIIALVLLHQQIGLSFLAGFGFALLLIPLNKWIANKISVLSMKRLDQKDKRIKLMSELLSGIRVVKMHAWEGHFASRITSVRREELKHLKGRKYLDAFCVYFWATTPVIISLVTFTMYSLLGHPLTAAKVFTCLSLFNLLITPLNAFPWVINGIVEAWVSLKRVQKFLCLKDLRPHEYYSTITNSNNSVEVSDGQFTWKKDVDDGSFLVMNERIFCLGPLNIEIKKGQFFGIVGTVGSGKSSFLQAVLAELYIKQGSVALNRQSHSGGSSNSGSISSFQEFFGGVGYVAQEPWILQTTVQQNILFGKPFNVFRYNRVLDACALLDDLILLPSGDQTEVGERGVTLSGGQKARIALARAVYQARRIIKYLRK